MNRRSFFKVVTGFVAGIFATSAKSKEKPQLTVAMLKKARDELVVAQKAANPLYVLYYVDDSKMIQEAIDLAKDGGVVYFPKGTYNLKYGIIV